jgi:hypothetical protein
MGPRTILGVQQPLIPKTNCNRLEKNQIEAARIMTGLSIYASIDSIYKKTGWETLSIRRFSLKYVNFLHYVPYGQYKCHQQIVYQNQSYCLLRHL